MVALAPSELVGVAETGRARVVGSCSARLLKREWVGLCAISLRNGSNLFAFFNIFHLLQISLSSAAVISTSVSVR
jgi:hypothetical protein